MFSLIANVIATTASLITLYFIVRILGQAKRIHESLHDRLVDLEKTALVQEELNRLRSARLFAWISGPPSNPGETSSSPSTKPKQN